MKRGRGRRIAFLSILAGLAAVGGIVANSPGYLVESWYRYKLHAGTKDREELIEKLGDVGSVRSVAPLIDVVRTEDAFRTPAVFALVHIFNRVPTLTKLAIAESFFEAAEAGDTAAAQGLLRLDLGDLEVGERYVEKFRSSLLDGDSEARGRYLARQPTDGTSVEVDLSDLPLVGDALETRMLAALRAEGLTEAESRALLEAWGEEFFETPGLRAIAMIPRWLYDTLLPLTIEPEPDELVRVGLLWKEIRS